jgi:hypothetical protein
MSIPRASISSRGDEGSAINRRKMAQAVIVCIYCRLAIKFGDGFEIKEFDEWIDSNVSNQDIARKCGICRVNSVEATGCVIG